MAEDGLERFYGIESHRDMYELESCFFDEWIPGANDELQHFSSSFLVILPEGTSDLSWIQRSAV